MRRAELYRLARQTLNERRQQAETQAILRRRDLLQRHPELAELDTRISAAGAQAALLAAAKNSEESKACLAQMDAYAKQRDALLKSLGLSQNALGPQYHCPLCQDTGRRDGLACQCLEEEVKRLRREEINRTGPLTLCQFENFKLDYYPTSLQQDGAAVQPRATMTAILQDCRDWAEEFGPRSQSLYMYGYSGLGKTHLALSIASRVLEAGHDVIYVSAQSVFSSMLADRETGEELFSSLLLADLLVLDDLGTENVTTYVRARLYELVNARMGRRPTIYTSNICKREVLEGRYDEKISSRLLGDCHLMRFWGEDIRLQKKAR